MAEDCSLAIFWSPDGFNSSLTPSLQEGCTIGEFHFTFLLQPLNTPPSGSRLPLANVVRLYKPAEQLSLTTLSAQSIIMLNTLQNQKQEPGSFMPIFPI
jgi:hypothetical protein